MSRFLRRNASMCRVLCRTIHPLATSYSEMCKLCTFVNKHLRITFACTILLNVLHIPFKNLPVILLNVYISWLIFSFYKSTCILYI